MLRTTIDVIGVLVDRDRVVPRPEHGRVVVVWRDRRQIPVTILGRDDEVLQRIELSAGGFS